MLQGASDAVPKENLWKYTKMGYDLVIFSGGKALRGPQSSGLLLGRKDLIEASYPAMSPFGGIGRGMKVGKEECCGLLAAVERYLRNRNARSNAGPVRRSPRTSRCPRAICSSGAASSRTWSGRASTSRCSSTSGTTRRAASVGVDARTSATSSSTGWSASWPMALTTGV